MHNKQKPKIWTFAVLWVLMGQKYSAHDPTLADQILYDTNIFEIWQD